MNQIFCEKDITSTWQCEDILVSIICTSYNHSKFIEQAIQGFLIQKTTFPFEIIIHDDASTDETVLILEEYFRKYPNLIKLIIQKDNKYSKGEKILIDYIVPECRGNYIALCEGDDYWIDENKLQKQFELMIKYKDCLISFHPAIGLRNNGSEKIISYHGDEDLLIPVEDVICGGGSFMPTASLMFHKSIFLKLSKFYNLYPNPPVGDLILQVIGSLPNGAIYFPDKASVYRIYANGSWSHRMQTDRAFAEINVLGLFKINEVLNEFSGFLYNKEFEKSNLLLINDYAFSPNLSKIFRKTIIKRYSPQKFGKFQILCKNLYHQFRIYIKQLLGYTA